jgi:hypothetical protein
MELIILGKSHDSNKEIEIFHKDHKCPHGFNVILTHKKEIVGEMVCHNKGDITTCYNVTEYHHLWQSKAKGGWRDRFACESDIHGTGWVPWNIFDKFSKVEVVKAQKEHNSFYEE